MEKVNFRSEIVNFDVTKVTMTIYDDVGNNDDGASDSGAVGAAR